MKEEHIEGMWGQDRSVATAPARHGHQNGLQYMLMWQYAKRYVSTQVAAMEHN